MRKLYRSTQDRKLFGVCGGLADYLGIDATLLRILLVIVTVFSGGTVLFVYIIAGFIIPRDADFGGGAFGGSMHGQGGWTPPHQSGWTPPQRPPAPPASSWNSGGPWPGPAAPAAKPAPQAPAAAQQTPTSTLDAMMEDIEKKALKKEIEELKARITKFEQQSKGE